MLGLGAFAFAAPGMLALLLALPVIYWLLRLIPPLVIDATQVELAIETLRAVLADRA